MRIERLLPLAAIAAVVLAGCNSARKVNETGASCTGCHGGADNETGAPPFDLAGDRTGTAVGAHTAHLAGGVACDSCHVVPETTGSPGHIDGDRRAEVVFGAAAKRDSANPAYVPVASPGKGGTCNGTYCHGATLGAGGENHDPVWTDVFTGGRCQQCHGFPPPGPNHPQDPDCSACHPTSVNADETIKVGGTHLNGSNDVGSIHPATWVMPLGSPQPHGLAANFHDPAWAGGLEDCRGCHGADLTGGTSSGAPAPSCAQCHSWPPQVTAGVVDCTFCHGDAQRTTSVAQNKAAPPVDTLGRTAATDRGVGAHQAHLERKALSTGVACGSCHPAQPYTDVAHVNGQVALALLQPGTANAVGTFDGVAGTCAASYCHGNFRAGNAGNAPAWTATSGQSDCGSCHRPQSGTTAAGYSDAHQFHLQIVTCAACHAPQYTPSAVSPALHVNGVKDVQASLNYAAAGNHTCTGSCHNGTTAVNPSAPWY